jgi:hypothetical protein
LKSLSLGTVAEERLEINATDVKAWHDPEKRMPVFRKDQAQPKI